MFVLFKIIPLVLLILIPAPPFTALTYIEIIYTNPHQQMLFPGETLTDECYGVGVVKDVAAIDTDTIITILYEAYFCVYRNSINAKNMIESKKIIPRYAMFT